MKRLLIILLFIAGIANAQISPFSFGGNYQYALDFDGSTEYLSTTPALRLTGEYSLYDNFSDGNYDGWTVSSGAYSVVDSVPLSGGTKALKCTSEGVIYIPCNQAYGSWEWDMKRASSGPTVGFISQINSSATLNGLYLTLDYIHRFNLSFNQGSGYIMITANDYVSINTWYRIKITRNTNGQFYSYIKGGVFGSNYVLVSVTGGTGTNPATNSVHSSSNYFTIKFNTNDMIANIVCQQGEGSLDLNSYERIYHSNNRAFEDTTGWRWTNNGNHSIVRNTDATNEINLIPDSASTFATSGVKYWYVNQCTSNWYSADSSMLLISTSSSTLMFFSKTNLVASGSVYKFKFRAKSPNHNARWVISNLSHTYYSAISNPNMNVDWQNYEFIVASGGTTPWIAVMSQQDLSDSIFVDNIIVEKLEGRTGFSGKLISTGAGDSTTNYISLPAVNFDTLKQDANGVYEKYTLEGWARGVGILGADTGSLSYGWTAALGGWVIANDTATATATNNSMTKTIGTTLNNTYKVTFKATVTSGTVQPVVGGYAGGTVINTTGSYTQYITATNASSNTTLYFTGNNFTGKITNITCQKITQPSITLKIGNQSKTITGISCVPSTFTKFVFNFQSNALVSNQPILLYLNQADTVFVDDVSLTKSYDLLVNTFALHGSSGADYLFARGGNNSTTNGYNSYINASNNFITAISGGTTQTTETNSATINTSNYYLQSSYFNRTGNQINYVNGVASTGTSLSGMGKIINTGTFYIGTLSGTGSDDWNGKIGHFRMIKFTDIAQSNVSASNLVNVYNLGKLVSGTWTGGSPVEVAFYDWKGATTNEILSDKSGTRNNLTGTNIDINDRIKVKGKFK